MEQQGFSLYEASQEEEEEEDDDGDDYFMNPAIADTKWLAVARPEQYLNIDRIKYLYADTRAVVSYRYDNGDLLMIRVDDRPVGYVAKSVGPFRLIREIFTENVFDRVVEIMVNRDGQEE
jgi:hypothetical protein